jgi:sulfonate transport system substrate-binding protein
VKRRRAALALAASLALAAAAPPTLNVADQKGVYHALCDAAHALDGAPYSIAWSEFPAAAPLLEALNANAVDIGGVGDSPMLFAYAAGAPIRAVLAVRPDGSGRGSAILVRPDAPFHTLADLHGHLVGTTRGSVGHALVLSLLAHDGLSPTEVRYAFLSPADARAALQSGGIDAWSTWEPYVSLETSQGAGRVLVDGAGVQRGMLFEVASVRAVQEKGALLGDFIKRLVRGLIWAKAHPAEYATIYAHNTGLPLDVARQTVAHMYATPAPMDAALIGEERALLALYVKAGVVAAAPDVAAVFDTRFEK